MRLRSFGALLVALLAAASPGAEPPNPLSGKGDAFPIAVWLQSPRNAERYKALGINLYVALWRGPTEEQLDILEEAGISVVCQQSERSLKFKDRKVIVGWMHDDEPDNAQPLGRGKNGWGPPVAPEKIVDDYKRMKAADPDRPVLLNLGQGVAWDNWYGRGVRSRHPEDYPQYLKGCDIASFDIYPVTHENKEVAGKLEFVGNGVGRLVDWTEGRKPVWACIETTHIDNAKALPTPEQVRAEVWMAVVHGATGIIYFCHEFKPHQLEAGLLDHPEIAEAVRGVNGELREWARVLNSPTVKGAATTSATGPAVTVLCKKLEGETHLFAVSGQATEGDVTVSVRELDGRSMVEVVGEGRTLIATDGRFREHFGPYEFHHYWLQN